MGLVSRKTGKKWEGRQGPNSYSQSTKLGLDPGKQDKEVFKIRKGPEKRAKAM